MTFHVFHVDEAYSNGDGTIQFIEFNSDGSGQQFWSTHSLNVSQSSTTHSFTFASDLPGDSGNKFVLVATQGYAQLAALAGLPTPDYIVPNGFLFTSGSINISFPGMQGGTVTGITIPRDGVNSANSASPLTATLPSSGFVTAAASPTNFSGVTGSMPLQPIGISTVADQAAGVGQEFNFAVSAGVFLNLDNDAVTYTATLADDSPLPAWLNFDGPTITFSGTPDTPVIISVKLIADDDDGAQGTRTFNITVISGHVVPGTGGADSLTGTAADDSITGLNGDDTLDGGTGIDSLVGGAGNDTYVVDGTTSVITEVSGQGTDTVLTSVTLPSLAANVENLTLASGSGNLNATGNSGNNVLTGNEGDNTFDGAGGADTFVGGDGNDTYLIDSTSDQITEDTNEGTDTVLTALTLPTLAANVENITLTGGGDVSAFGNGLGNVLTGNTGHNLLSGGAGNDTLDGGLGNDTLRGGADNDAFLFTQLSGVDRIDDFASGVDQIQLDDAMFTALSAGAVAATQLQTGLASEISATSGDGDDYLKYASDTGQLYYDDNGSGAGGLTLIAVLASPGCGEANPTIDLTTAQDIFVT